MAAGGKTHSRPWSASGRPRKNGDATPSGWIAEQTSCTNPGSVSSAERVPPPIVSLPSSTRTERPGARQGDGRGQPVGAGADDNGVMRWTMAHFDFIGLA